MRIALSLVLSLFLVLPAFAQEQLALITEVKGEVSILRADGATEDARWGAQLYAGDRVRTASDGQVSVMYSSSEVVSIAGNQETSIYEGGGADAASGVDPTLLADVSDLTLHRTGVGEVSALGGLRASGAPAEIEAVSPRNTRVRSSRPMLEWEAAGEFDVFRISVLSESGLVWEGEAAGSGVEYPADAPALSPGERYFWRVTGEDMIDEVESALVSFFVLDEAGAGRLASAEGAINARFEGDEDSSRLYMLGSLYAKEGLNTEAIAAFESIARNHSNSAFLHEVLAKLYYETGQKDRAIDALNRAVDLGRTR